LKRSIVHKIDPVVMSHARVRVNSNEPFRVILYANEYNRCRPVLDQLGIKVSAEIPLIDGYIVDIPISKLERIAGHKDVRYIAADIDIKAQMNIASQVVRADRWHKSGITGKGVGIAIIDTGIYPHPDFTMPRNRIAAFLDIVNSRIAPYDDNGHGTFVAGVAAGNGQASSGQYRGFAPNASIVALKVMDSSGGGKSSDVLNALQWIANNNTRYNIKVVSMSLGSTVGVSNRDDAMERGAEQLWRRGITVVAAAGNDGPDPMSITVPGTSPVLITVGSSDDKRTVRLEDDTIPEFSSRGPVGGRAKPDIVAPGVNIKSAYADTTYQPGRKIAKLGNYYTVMSGTSVSTPLIAGIAALMYEKNPQITPDMVKQEIMKGGYKLTGVLNNEGRGIVQI
jgi:serine protease AprX